MDRPLSVAGRVLVQENGTIVSRLVALDRDLLMIPSVAIHMNREVNDKASFNKQVDMLPVLGGACEEGALKKLIAEELQVSEEQILGSDLFLYVREKATVWGCNEEFISCGRLDDQQCVYGILKGLLTAKNARSIGVAAFFDNEEVGSGTKQGAASTFLYDVLHRIAQSLGRQRRGLGPRGGFQLYGQRRQRPRRAPQPPGAHRCEQLHLHEQGCGHQDPRRPEVHQRRHERCRCPGTGCPRRCAAAILCKPFR